MTNQQLPNHESIPQQATETKVSVTWYIVVVGSIIAIGEGIIDIFAADYYAQVELFGITQTPAMIIFATILGMVFAIGIIGCALYMKKVGEKKALYGLTLALGILAVLFGGLLMALIPAIASGVGLGTTKR